MLRIVLADRLETMSRVLQALGNEPRALETVTEAVAIYSALIEKHPDRNTGRLARMLLQQAALLAHMGRHGEALAAIEPAVQVYRRLTIKDRSAYLPSLATALSRQADELGHLDRITEARAAAAEAEMISTDMLPPTQSFSRETPAAAAAPRRAAGDAEEADRGCLICPAGRSPVARPAGVTALPGTAGATAPPRRRSPARARPCGGSWRWSLAWGRTTRTAGASSAAPPKAEPPSGP